MLSQVIGRKRGAGQFFNFVGVTPHVLGTRSLNWMIMFFVPVTAIAFDVAGKVFSNMYYPTQTQIHIETESRQKRSAKRRPTRDTGRPSSDISGGV